MSDSASTTRRLSDDFLRDVARAYAAAVARREHPNLAIAREFGTKVRTVERWIVKARDRGIMPRGKQGRMDGWVAQPHCATCTCHAK